MARPCTTRTPTSAPCAACAAEGDGVRDAGRPARPTPRRNVVRGMEPTTPPSTGTRLDPWVDAYAARTHGMTASEIRALFAVATRPEVVSLAGGMPNIAALPLDVIADTVARLIRERGTVALQYGSGPGRRRRCASRSVEVMALEGIRAHPDDVVVTVGSQQALDLVTRIFCDPGDVDPRRGAVATSARSASSAPTRPRSCTSRWTTTGCVPDALRRGARRSSRAAGQARSSSSTRSRTSTTPPA